MEKLAFLKGLDRLILVAQNEFIEVQQHPAEVESDFEVLPVKKEEKKCATKSSDDSDPRRVDFHFEAVSEPRQPLLRPEYPKDAPGVSVFESEISKVNCFIVIV